MFLCFFSLHIFYNISSGVISAVVQACKTETNLTLIPTILTTSRLIFEWPLILFLSIFMFMIHIPVVHHLSYLMYSLSYIHKVLNGQYFLMLNDFKTKEMVVGPKIEDGLYES